MSYADLSAWAFIIILAVLLFSMLIGNILRRFVPFLRKTLIPVSVMGGLILLIISTITYYCAGDYLFNLPLFGGDGSNGAYSGMEILELITYHCLGIGFVASGMRTSKKKFTKQRAGEVFDSGLTTVNGYLIQAFAGLAVTLIAVRLFNTDGLISAAGILLAFGFGQGTGQAMNFGKTFESFGFVGGSNFGLTIAALGFLVACIVGVIYINVMRRKGQIKIVDKQLSNSLSDYEDENEISLVSSMDKFSVQVAIVLAVYGASFGIMYGLSKLIPSFATTLFGFNFFLGVLLTIPVKAVLNKLYDKKIIKKQVVNNFMMDRIGGFAFDLMIVAGVAAIRIPLLASYWAILLIMAVAGALVTVFYVNFVCKRHFSSYRHEQFLAFFGMLTGTASTGMILLREIDGTYRTPASENLIFQNIPAMVFGLPLMFLANFAPQSDLNALITCIIVGVAFVVLNLVLFRKNVFKRRRKAVAEGSEVAEQISGESDGGADGSVSGSEMSTEEPTEKPDERE
ncbi:MAG: hypothetical protein NC132_05010 [Corallococcus sp.]|nr:hypothetical protein [Corallococcus sp.]MCM1359748.1 hypothetical protein [Corallococcus sp.]MCM1395457.1 hypothetical protein [Corallococcus sp.]